MRQDLKYAAFAVALGFALTDHHGQDLNEEKFLTHNGVPTDSLAFRLGRVRIWQTARGWRVARLKDDGTFPHAEDSDFHRSLFKALQAGAKLAE